VFADLTASMAGVFEALSVLDISSCIVSNAIFILKLATLLHMDVLPSYNLSRFLFFFGK
jgi:hypothetical protein